MGTGMGIPPRGWGSILKTQVESGTGEECDGLLALPVSGGSHVLDGQEPEASSTPQRTQNWSPVAKDRPLVSGTPQFQLDRVPPGGAAADPREDSERHPMQPQVTIFMK